MGPFRNAIKWWGQRTEDEVERKEFTEVSAHVHRGERLFGEKLSRLTNIAGVA